VGALVTSKEGAVRNPMGDLAELYQRHAQAAGRFAFLLTGDRVLAEDLVQDAFVRVIGRFHHLRVPGAFWTYLRRTIVNLHTSLLRHRRVERAYLEREGRAPSQTGPADLDDREDLWRAVLALPPRQRAAIVLRYYEDLSEREAADVLGCSTAAAKSLIARATEALRAQIGSELR